MAREPWLFASDIDNTLTGDEPALRELGATLVDMRERGELVLFLVTGRRLDQVVPGFEAEGIPVPDAVVSQVGTEIYLPPYGATSRPLEAWDQLLRQRFNRAQAETFLEGVEGLEIQPARFNTPLKVSCYLDKAPDPHEAAATIARRVEPEAEAYQVVWSSGRDLDVIPAAAGKGRAIRFLIEHLSLKPRGVIVAGDSGNDRSMFDEFGRGIVVANAQDELAALRNDPAAAKDIDLYFARAPYAAGVAEGLRQFGVL